MTGRRIWVRTAAGAAALTAVAGLAAGCSASGSGSGTGTATTPAAGGLPTNFGPAEKTTLNVAVVPAMDSADLNQGATTDFPIEGYVVTKQWAAQHPNTLRRFPAALEMGQKISDTDRGAVEQAFEAIKGPQNGQVGPGIAAVMALDNYPIGVDVTRIQRVADVMYQFGVLNTRFNASSMLLPSSFFNFAQFSSSSS